MLALIMPTRDRKDDLSRTLDAIGRLRLSADEAEVVVVDNASHSTPVVPRKLANKLPVTLLRRGSNEGAAARTAGAMHVDASRKWLVMLDDDSAPVENGGPTMAEILKAQPDDVGAVMADIHLPLQGRRESGGLPEVPVGCGVAYRREAYLHAGGYDPLFNYYVEEYDLAARLLLAGWRIVFDPRWRVEHRKVDTGRDMNIILERLVRNNGWVMARYAPSTIRGTMIAEVIDRYGRIAEKEGAVEGYRRGLVQLQRTVHDQPREEMSQSLWDRFTGMTAARQAIKRAMEDEPFESASIVAPGKNEWVVRQALNECGVKLENTALEPGKVVQVVGTMSPGPMLDARDSLKTKNSRVVLPWLPAWEPGEDPRARVDRADGPVPVVRAMAGRTRSGAA